MSEEFRVSPETHKFVTTVKEYVDRIIDVVRDARPGAYSWAEPEWFANLDCSYFHGNCVLTCELNDLLTEKSVYDIYRQEHESDEESCSDNEQVNETVDAEITDEEEESEPEINSPCIPVHQRKQFKYPKLSIHSYSEILQLLADEINDLHANVENTSKNIEELSNNLVKTLNDWIDGDPSTKIEELVPLIHKYIEDIFADTINYSVLNDTVHEIGYEIAGDNLDELLESRYYVLADLVYNEGWFSAERDLEYLVQQLEDELERDYNHDYTRVREHSEWFDKFGGRC